MALLHATPLFSGNITATAFTTVYTVPAGMRIIIRSVAVRNAAAAAQVVSLAVDAVNVWVKNLTTGGTDGSAFEWRPWIVLTEGQTIRVHVSNSAGAAFTISGSIYTI